MFSGQNRDCFTSSYAEVIKSTKGGSKINIDEFLYKKDRNPDHRYYWVCERKAQKATKCTARTITVYVGKQHRTHKVDADQHNHAPEASKPEALKVCLKMKQLAEITNDPPAKIISNILATTSREIQPCLL